ncbi:MBL fold metallo-hydrolase [Clostridium sp. cel8]|jgi:competence protein ComEC|uniref:ComEC/Rec2 family competence protein n=1 Tax=unclassified Clostridium TaxID=2614128 RepID=UPI0015F58019|nr:ComEC/Rec2 family competence protein [Clostridium sp. cel8]MBA5850127.1 MBL fold metallo-hydrolase [Clostridium sp. cel8]
MKFSKKLYIFVLVIFFFISILSGCSSVETSSEKSNYSGLKVSYIDVGQGDSELIQVNGKNLLIDSGPNDSESNIMTYLKKENITKLDYVIATHPHEDHIGNMAQIIKKYEIDSFIAPKKVVNTKTFENMIEALKEKDMKITVPHPGDTLDLGENVKAEILAPNSSSYPDTNNYSVVLKITYANTSFLFTGDAEKTSEAEMLNNNYDLSSDVLKVGHHGSSTSTTEDFLNNVNPKIAVISCGKDNKYGHPNRKTLNNLKKKNIQVYRTDIDGTIVLLSDGDKITKE